MASNGCARHQRCRTTAQVSGVQGVRLGLAAAVGGVRQLFQYVEQADLDALEQPAAAQAGKLLELEDDPGEQIVAGEDNLRTVFLVHGRCIGQS